MRKKRGQGGFAAVAVLTLLTLLLIPGLAFADLFRVHVEKGKRKTSSGDRVGYALFVPVPDPGLPAPPWPAVILLHGFGRDHRYHAKNAEYMAKRGVVVLAPDMTRLTLGRPAQRGNITGTVDHIRWLIRRSGDERDPLKGLIDPGRIGLAGHSAGGAVAFEAAVEAQARGIAVGALCLLDAVPWDRTLDLASTLTPLPFASLRSEPGICNFQGNVRVLLHQITFLTEDVLITGSHHCDAENPTDRTCVTVCWGKSGKGQHLYQRLMYLFFQDAFEVTSVEKVPTNYAEALRALELDGAIERKVIQEGPEDPDQEGLWGRRAGSTPRTETPPLF